MNFYSSLFCPPPQLHGRLDCVFVEQVPEGCESAMGGSVDSGNSVSYADGKEMQAAELKNLSETDVIAKVGVLFTEDQRKKGILTSVSLAQFILESGYGKSELAQNANNVFGMKG